MPVGGLKSKRDFIFKILTNRFFYIGLALLVQLIFLFFLIWKFVEYSFWVESFLVALSVILVIWILNTDTLVDYKIAWLIPILAFPIFGTILYLVFGGNKTTRSERIRLQEIHDNMNKALRKDPLHDQADMSTVRRDCISAANQASYLRDYALLPPFRHTDADYFPQGEDYFEAMLKDMEKAEDFIFLEYFIIDHGVLWDRILDILERKIKEGVDVRLIYDDIGTITRFSIGYQQQLESRGIRTAVFSPFHPVLNARFNNRNHRKITVIDGRYAYTGGVNIADEYINAKKRFGHWKDNGIRLRGPAVASFTMMFLSMWDYLKNEDTDFSAFIPHDWGEGEGHGLVQPFSDSPLNKEAVSEAVYRNLIGQAMKSIYIFTPYLVLSDEMESAISNAAKRGVEVTLVTPHIPDKRFVQAVSRSYYHRMVEAGVQIYEYEIGFLHSKAILVDDEYAIVGSINMDYRSLYLHFECAVWLYNSPALYDLKEDFINTIDAHGILIDQESLDKVPLATKLARSLLRVFAPLM